MNTLFEWAKPPPDDTQENPGFERPQEPYSALRPDGHFACMICGRPAHFGFDVKLRAGRLGRWSCSAHRDTVKNICR
jgi:hypothetical protein